MRYELPKSYSERTVASGQPKLFFPQSNPPATANNSGKPSQIAVRSPHPTKKTSASSKKDFIPAADYQKLLLELRRRDKEHERLQQVFKQLLADFSKLQTNYEQVVSKIGRSSPSTPSSDRNPAASHSHSYEPEGAPQQAVSRVPNAPDFNNSDGNLPELSYLNRLRERERNLSSKPERKLKGMANSATFNTGSNPSSPPLVNMPPHLSELGEETESIYQRARQEHTNARTPIWMWIVAWLLLLPISAGLGYTLVQWTIHSGSPTDLPAQVAPAE